MLSSNIFCEQQNKSFELPKTISQFNNNITSILKKYLNEALTEELLVVIRNSLLNYLYNFVYYGFLKKDDLNKIECKRSLKKYTVDSIPIEIVDNPSLVCVFGIEEITDKLIKANAFNMEQL